jgi:hypothetical protein
MIVNSHILVSKLHAQFSLLRRPKGNNQLVSIGINHYLRETDGSMPLLAQNGMSAVFTKIEPIDGEKSKKLYD